MSIYPVKMMSDSELIATILGKRQVDAECDHVAAWVVREGGVTDILSGQDITPTRLNKIEAALELGRRTNAARAARLTKTLSRPEDVAALMAPIFQGLEREVFYCLALNTKNYLKHMFEVSIGSLNASIVHPRELYKEAVRCSAASIIVTHNHPSGDSTPSGADIQLTRRIAQAGDVLGIELLDHVVIGGEDNYVSLRDSSLI